jgi:hypothetical protein
VENIAVSQLKVKAISLNKLTNTKGMITKKKHKKISEKNLDAASSTG